MKKDSFKSTVKKFHVPNTKLPIGHDMGLGVKQKVGKMHSKLEDTWVPSKKMKTPPKKLA